MGFVYFVVDVLSFLASPREHMFQLVSLIQSSGDFYMGMSSVIRGAWVYEGF